MLGFITDLILLVLTSAALTVYYLTNYFDFFGVVWFPGVVLGAIFGHVFMSLVLDYKKLMDNSYHI